MTEIEELKAQIKVLQSKLSFLEELEKTKSPVEEAYKDAYGKYPVKDVSEELTAKDNWNVISWDAFQMGYNAAYEEKVTQEPEENEWKSVALRFGEKLSDVGPCGYYELSPAAWFRWAVFTYGKGQQIKNAVRESVKWCEEHPEESVEDYLTPKTPEQTEQSLKEAFREAQQTERWKEIQKLIDEEDNDKNFKNSLDLIKEWGEKNKPPTLKELLWEWWEDIFTVDSDLDADASIDVLVDRIDKEFIPPSSEKNGYEWEKCLKMMRENLR